MYVRPLGIVDRLRAQRVKDVSLGGIRAYSDEERLPGERLQLEISSPGAEPVVVAAEVVRVERLPSDAAARFDVGLRFVGTGDDELLRIERMLATARRD